MATPKQGYTLPDGTKVPGTTTVIGRFKDSGGLMLWAFNQGKSGAAKLYDAAEKAADIGTLAHSMVEAHINGTDPEAVLIDKPDADKARNAYEQFVKWESQTNIKFLSKFQEIQLVSLEYKFGGTPDAIGEIDGRIALLDWKTSNGVYSDYLIQLAAYAHLIQYGVRMDTGEPLSLTPQEFHLLRFSKDFPDFEHRSFGELDQAWEQFKLFRSAYDNDKSLKKRAA